MQAHFWISALACGLFALPTTLSGYQQPSSRTVYAWLIQQQQHTGLLGNEDGDTFSGLYANALAAMCYIHQSDIRRAERVFEFFDQQYVKEFAAATPGGFHQFWDAKSGAVHPDSDRWVGDNAWLLIALNYYYYRVDRMRFNDLRAGLARWLTGLQDADGGVRSGFNKDGPIRAKSTEGNLDCYAALIEYPAARAKVRDWLQKQMWVESEGRFRMGSTVNESALDDTTWALGALGRDYAATLRFAEKTFGRTDTVRGQAIRGVADFADKQRIWLEGTGEMVVAYQVAGESRMAQDLLAQMQRAMIPSAAHPGTWGLPCFTSNPTWETASTRIFIPAQAWYLFGTWKFNPMRNHAASVHTH